MKTIEEFKLVLTKNDLLCKLVRLNLIKIMIIKKIT